MFNQKCPIKHSQYVTRPVHVYRHGYAALKQHLGSLLLAFLTSLLSEDLVELESLKKASQFAPVTFPSSIVFVGQLLFREKEGI